MILITHTRIFSYSGGRVSIGLGKVMHIHVDEMNGGGLCAVVRAPLPPEKSVHERIMAAAPGTVSILRRGVKRIENPVFKTIANAIDGQGRQPFEQFAIVHYPIRYLQIDQAIGRSRLQIPAHLQLLGLHVDSVEVACGAEVLDIAAAHSDLNQRLHCPKLSLVSFEQFSGVAFHRTGPLYLRVTWNVGERVVGLRQISYCTRVTWVAFRLILGEASS